MNALEFNSYLNSDCSFILPDNLVLSGIIIFFSFGDKPAAYYFISSKDKKRYYQARSEGNKELMRRYCMTIDIGCIKHALKIPVKQSIGDFYNISVKKLYHILLESMN